MAPDLLALLVDWLSIPSVSTGGGDPADLERAAAWAVERVRAAGGEGDVLATAGHPLAVGELRADRDGDVPTVLIYGHYDVQGPGDLSLWDSPPFAPEVRDGRVYARGAADDKGNFLPLLHAACELKAAGELPVHVRVVVEGEEEVGSQAVLRWVEEDERGADCAVVFDSGMVDARTPAVTVGLRGLVMAQVAVRTGRRDVHSGLYGGVTLNALHALHAMLAPLLPGPDGRVPPALREGIVPPSEAERASWASLPPGEEELRSIGARPAYPGAGADLYERTGADASLDVNQIRGGEPRTLVPAIAHAAVSLRLAPRQSPARMREVLERTLRDAAPEGTEVELRWHDAEPVLFEPDLPAIELAVEALERACGARPALIRMGGSIPVVAALAKRMPVVVSGFVLPDDAFHAPNESFSLESLRLGHLAGRELLRGLAGLARD